jgi:hypothetical protein
MDASNRVQIIESRNQATGNHAPQKIHHGALCLGCFAQDFGAQGRNVNMRTNDHALLPSEVYRNGEIGAGK